MKILYEDGNLLAVDKPAGVLVYWPAHFKNNERTLLDEVSAKLDYPTKGERNGVVHRLDRDTSGVILFAKNEKAEATLKKMFKNREMGKYYTALVEGKVEPKEGMVTIPLGRASKDRLRVVPKASGKPSETLYRVAKYYPDSNVSLLEIELKTGRTHQIRVHMKHIGYPLLGDWLYGKNDDDLISRQALHAASLEFFHPTNRNQMSFSCCMPEDMQRLEAEVILDT